MSKIEVNQISSQCGSTLTVGQSGDTVTLAAGATQTGFGRTGTVDWDTTAKTASFTAVSGNGYFVNTTSGAVTMTLPATPSAGDIVSVKDYAYTFATNNLTVNRNGSPIGGGSDINTIDYSTNGDFLTFIYVDGTQGWVLTNDSTNTDNTIASFITATGGTVTCCGDYRIHTFTGPGTFTVTCAGNPAGSDTVDYLVVAGGAGGGGNSAAAGGGAGGFRASSTTYTIGCAPAAPLTACVSALTVTATAFPITVGSGGAGGGASTNGVNGNNSVFSTVTSTGAGGGASDGSPTSGGGATPSSAPAGYATGVSGGSGGGTRGTFLSPGGPQPNNYYFNPAIGCFAATGNTPPVSPPQGNPGGMGYDGLNFNSQSGGGGGAIAAGSAARGPGQGTNTGGPGGAGAGLPSAFGTSGQNCGAYYYFAGGGGGGQDPTSGPGGTGAIGGGGTGGGPGNQGLTAGTTNTGGGGGGGNTGTGGAGGSGIVIIRYKFQ